MMSVMYNLSINLYWIIIRIVAIFNGKAAKFVKGRSVSPSNFNIEHKPVAWFHCASLGEFEQGRPVIESFKNEFPDLAIVITFFSPSGYEIRKNYALADLVTYLPIDTPKKAHDFINLINPSLCIFVKYEFWYNYLKILHQKSIPIIAISAIFRAEQVFFKSYGGFFKNILKKFDHLFVQNEHSLQLLKSIKIKNASVAGDTRFDRVAALSESVKPNTFVHNFKGNHRLMVIGSSWPEDMKHLIPFINSNSSIKFVIAPHEINSSEITKMEKEIAGKTIRYSNFNHANVDAQVLFIDNVGMLSSLYQYGEFAYIGGAFGKGLHNILEAATFGLPIFFGNKHYRKFQEAVDLVENGGAFTISDHSELKKRFSTLLELQNWKKSSQVCKNYVISNTGATDAIINYCKTKITNEG